MQNEGEPRKPPREPDDFVKAVRLAYKLDLGAGTDAAIASAMGIGRSALSQLFGGPKNFKRETLANFLRPIRSPELREGIIRAYEGTVLPEPSEGPADASTIGRIQALRSENRPDAALALAWKALGQELGDLAYWTHLVLACGLAFRLDVPDETMRAASLMHEFGLRTGRAECVAAAIAVSARAMRRTTFYTYAEIGKERKRAWALLTGLSAGNDEFRVRTFARDVLQSEDVVTELLVHEAMGGREEILRTHLRGIAELRKGRASKGNPPAPALFARVMQLEALIHLGLGELERAETAIEDAAEAGGGTPDGTVGVEYLRGKLQAARGEAAEAERTLRRMVEVCERDRFVYMARLARTELARLYRAGIDVGTAR